MFPRLAAFVLAVGLALGLAGCDFVRFWEDDFDVPPERLGVLTAVYERDEGEPAPMRLVLFDVANPLAHAVLDVAGASASRPCFSPDKSKLLFEDDSESTVGSRAAIKLLDLETREVRPLDVTGDLKGCVWRADGSGFYYAAALGAGLRRAAVYDLASGETRPFAQTEDRVAAFPYGRKGRDSILVLAPPKGGFDREVVPFFFVDAETGEYLEQIENEHLRFEPWENPERGGHKHSVFTPVYNDDHDMIAFRRNAPESKSDIAVTDLDGASFDVFGQSANTTDAFPRWGPNRIVLFTREAYFGGKDRRVMILNPSTGEIRELVQPSVIDGAVALTQADY